MKKQFYSKLLFLFALLLVGTTAWADNTLYYTLDGTITGGSNGYATESEITQNSMTWMVTGNTTESPWRIGGKKLTSEDRPVYSTTATTEVTSQIDVTLGTSSLTALNSVTLIVASDADFSTVIDTQTINAPDAQTTLSFTPSTGVTWVSGSYIKLVFNVSVSDSSKNKYVQLTKIELYKAESSGTPTCAAPTFSPKAGTYAETQNVTISTTTSDATIYYTTDGTDPTTSSTVYTAPVSVSTSQTLKAIATASGYDNSSVATAAYTIVTIEHAGTETDPYTVADARNAIDANEGLTDVHYVKGIISQVDSYYSTYHSITYWISDDGTTANQLQVYSGKGIDGANFNSKEDLQVGDKVVVSGTLKKFNSTTYEFDKNNELVSLEREAAPVVPSVTAEPAQLDVDAAEHNGSITITYNNITDVDPQILTVDADGEEATYDWITTNLDVNKNIEYTIEKNTGAARTAYLKVHVNDVYSNLITINQAKAPEQSTEFTVKYYVAGEEFNTTRWEGEALNLPDQDARGGYQFAGWSTVEDAAVPDFVENTAAVNSDLTLYAIFASKTVYTKVTATEDITDGKYLIVYEGGNLAFNGSLETLDASGNTIEVKISNNTIVGSETVDAATFTIDATAGTIQSASGKYIGQTSDANGLAESEETGLTNTLSIDDNGNAVVLSSGGAYLRYNSTSGQIRFRYYKSSTYTAQKAIQLYKQIASAIYTLNEPEVSITAAANATWVAPAKVEVLTKGVKVYTVTYDDAVGCTRKHEVTDRVVPANGVVLLTSDAATTVTFEKTTAEAAAYADLANDLLGSDGTRKGGANIFCLALGEKGLGFYPVSDKICVPAGKAYLKIGEDSSTVDGAPSYIWFNDDTTAIDSLTPDTAAGNENGEIYSLTGQRVGKNYRGIVIMNGRKVLKK